MQTFVHYPIHPQIFIYWLTISVHYWFLNSFSIANYWVPICNFSFWVCFANPPSMQRLSLKISTSSNVDFINNLCEKKSMHIYLLICCCANQPLFTFVLSFLFIFTFMRLYLYLNLWEKTFLYLGGHGQCSIFYWFVVALINLCCGSPPRIGQMYCALFYWFLHKIPPLICQMYLCIISIDFFIKSHHIFARCICALLISIDFFIKAHHILPVVFMHYWFLLISS